MSNSDNPLVGARFQDQVRDWFSKKYKTAFSLDKGIVIGDPPKEHRFDIVDKSGSIAIECKCYTWTVSGNVPSAKMAFANEAFFYLRLLPSMYTTH